MSTGFTVVQSLLGTLAGFVLSVPLITVAGESWALWVALPVLVFLTAYTPTAVHFVVGQASFTLFVVVLFNLLEPEGWRTGLLRLGDIALGAGVALVVSLVFWPRGPAHVRRGVGAIASGGRSSRRRGRPLPGRRRDRPPTASRRPGGRRWRRSAGPARR